MPSPPTRSNVCATLAACLAALASAPTAHAVTLEEAVRLAFEESPRVRAAKAEVAEAGGARTRAGLYPYNPELELEGGARVGPDDTTADLGVSLGQRLEIAGQRGHREDAAEADLEAARERLRRALRLLAADVRLAFVAALEAGETLEVAEAEHRVVAELHDLTERRLNEGAGTRLDVNVAAAELGRAEEVLRRAEADHVAARAVLAERIGLEADALPEAEGDLTALDDGPVEDLEALLDAARRHRADLRELERMEAAARARLEVARAEAWPDPTVRVFAKREDGSENIYGVGLRVPIPAFQRNQGEAESRRAAIRRAEAQRDEARLGVVRDVVVARARYLAERRAVEGLRERVLGTLEESLSLLRRSFEAGKSTWLDVLVMRRSLFDARRALVRSAARAQRARIRLDLASGRDPDPGGLPADEVGP